jgi:hypothetical protein
MSTIHPTCPHCSRSMKLVRTIPAVGPTWPALLVFYCGTCEHADTHPECESMSSEVTVGPAAPATVHPARMDWGALS